jgi:hypothetical protein
VSGDQLEARVQHFIVEHFGVDQARGHAVDGDLALASSSARALVAPMMPALAAL